LQQTGLSSGIDPEWMYFMLEDKSDLVVLTADLVSAFVTHNRVRGEELPGLIQTTYATLSGLTETPQAEPAKTEYAPAVSVRKSLGSREHIISMIDGKPYRSLKRHLSAQGLSFDEYRSRYNLPDSYPSVAPGYSEARRDIAKRLGLGRKPKAAVPAPGDTAPAPKRAARATRTRTKTA
jgi:predicted transcriptional regulator